MARMIGHEDNPLETSFTKMPSRPHIGIVKHADGQVGGQQEAASVVVEHSKHGEVKGARLYYFLDGRPAREEGLATHVEVDAECCWTRQSWQGDSADERKRAGKFCSIVRKRIGDSQTENWQVSEFDFYEECDSVYAHGFSRAAEGRWRHIDPQGTKQYIDQAQLEQLANQHKWDLSGVFEIEQSGAAVEARGTICTPILEQAPAAPPKRARRTAL